MPVSTTEPLDDIPDPVDTLLTRHPTEAAAAAPSLATHTHRETHMQCYSILSELLFRRVWSRPINQHSLLRYKGHSSHLQ